jgi:hypothetical protein
MIERGIARRIGCHARFNPTLQAAPIRLINRRNAVRSATHTLHQKLKVQNSLTGQFISGILNKPPEVLQRKFFNSSPKPSPNSGSLSIKIIKPVSASSRICALKPHFGCFGRHTKVL